MITNYKYDSPYLFLAVKASDTFSEVEKRLYFKYPFLADEDIVFFANGKVIDRTRTLEENNIKHGNCIYVINNEDDENKEFLDNKEKIISLSFLSADQCIFLSLIVSCKPSDKFYTILEKLFKKYPDLGNKNIYFYFFSR